MPGGVSYHCPVLVVGGTTKYDVTRWSVSLSADILFNRGDCRLYPQQATSVNHRATLEASCLDLSNTLQASSSATLIGSSVATLTLTLDNNSGAGTMVYTMSPSVYTKADASGSYSDLASLDFGFEAAGTGGTEPTVSWAKGL